MKIGLIDVDNQNKIAKFPNIALMKLSGYHKSIGDHVEWYSLKSHYDIVYCSKVFDFSEDIHDIKNAIKVVKGGRVADLSKFWRGQKEIVLLDPNLTLCRHKYIILDQLIESKATIDFSQGLDIRSLTNKFIGKLNKIKFNTIHFAWDNYEFKTYNKLKKVRPLLKGGRRKYTVYVLVNYNTTIDQDLERVMKLKDLDYWPYIMIYDKPNASILHTKMQRWVNNRAIWEKGLTYHDYINSFKNIPYEYYEWKKEIEGQQLTIF